MDPAREISTRHAAIANLYMPFKAPTKEVGLEFFRGLSEAGLPEFAYRYRTNLVEGRSLSTLDLSVQEGRYRFDVKVDHYNGALRLLTTVFFPQSWTVAERQLEMIVKLFEASMASDLETQLVEVRTSHDVPTMRGTARANLGQRFFGIQALKGLGDDVDLGSVMLRTAPENREPTAAIDNPSREIRIEPLLEDVKRIYIEVMSQWPRATPTLSGSTMHLAPGPLSVGQEAPTVYLRNVREYVENNVIPFVNAARS